MNKGELKLRKGNFHIEYDDWAEVWVVTNIETDEVEYFEDESTMNEYIEDSNLYESIRRPTKRKSIRESIKDLDYETDYNYDLLSTYDSFDLEDEDESALGDLLDAEDVEEVSKFLSDKYYSHINNGSNPAAAVEDIDSSISELQTLVNQMASGRDEIVNAMSNMTNLLNSDDGYAQTADDFIDDDFYGSYKVSNVELDDENYTSNDSYGDDIDVNFEDDVEEDETLTEDVEEDEVDNDTETVEDNNEVSNTIDDDMKFKITYYTNELKDDARKLKDEFLTGEKSLDNILTELGYSIDKEMENVYRKRYDEKGHSYECNFDLNEWLREISDNVYYYFRVDEKAYDFDESGNYLKPYLFDKIEISEWDIEPNDEVNLDSTEDTTISDNEFETDNSEEPIQ